VGHEADGSLHFLANVAIIRFHLFDEETAVFFNTQVSNGPAYNRRQQFPHQKILTPDGGHIGQNMY
jgi:hypothetical protein